MNTKHLQVAINCIERAIDELKENPTLANDWLNCAILWLEGEIEATQHPQLGDDNAHNHN